MLHIKNIYSASSEKEALEYMRKYPGAKLLAAGTDLIPRIRNLDRGRDEGAELIDISGIEEWKRIDIKEEEICMGPLVTHREIAENSVIQQEFTALAEACRQIGSLQIRNVATIGGNIGNASPAGDSLPALVAFGAEVGWKKPDTQGVQERRKPLAFLLEKKWKKDPEADGLITGIRIPRGKYTSAFEKIGGRNALVISIASCAVALGADGYRVTFGSMNPWVTRQYQIEDFLNDLPAAELAEFIRGQKYIEEFQQLLQENLHPISDVRGSGEYRLAVAGGLLRSNLAKIGGMTE